MQKTDRMPFDRTFDRGPFDIIGDVHGCYDELIRLLTEIGYRFSEKSEIPEPPPGRKLIFIGDLVDRGPKILPVLKLVMDMAERGLALALAGNHENKLMRALKGANLTIGNGLEHSLDQLKEISDEFRERIILFLQDLPAHYMLDGGKLAAAHGGISEELQGTDTKKTKSFTLYGLTDGIEPSGFPRRLDWASDYKGEALVVYGHNPVEEPRWLNNTVNIDTGCVFGGRLTALRYPERKTISVKASRPYYTRPGGIQTPKDSGF